MNRADFKIIGGLMAGLLLLCIAVFGSGCGDAVVPPAENGAACEVAGDCSGDVCVTELGDAAIVFPGGMCSNECDTSDPGSCADDERCLIYRPTGEQYCYQRCSPGAQECREGYLCQNIDGLGFCLPPLQGVQ